MTIGDILAVIGALVLVAASWAATLLVIALACPRQMARAQERIETRPGRCFGQGLLTLTIVGLVAVALGQSHAGPLRLVAGALWAGMAAVAALGTAGIANMLGQRIQETGTQMPPFASLTRGAFLVVTAGFLPIVGWFLVLPVVTLISLGSGMSVLLARVPRRRRRRRAADTASPYLTELAR